MKNILTAILRRILPVLLFTGAAALSAHAAPVTVTGTVLDSEGLEAIGAVVQVKGSDTKVITDINGAYNIKVDKPRKAVLTFTYIGCLTKEEPVNGRTKVDVVLQSNNKVLDEVVVIGYATVKRKDLTGSVSSMRSDEVMKTPGGDATQALAGRMSGVQVVQSDGQPGSSPSIRVRGGISITQDNSPLYIIDGVPNEDGMSNINPNDIESIDVLKDASATAIYGARGANGVVVITTKSGGENDGKNTVSFDAYVGWRHLANRLNTLSTEEFVLADYERVLGRSSTAPEDGGMNSWQQRYGGFADIHANYGNRPGIDWLDRTMGRTTLTQSYRVTFSGGNKKLNYYMSYGYFDDEGAMIHSGSEKHSISANIRSEINKRLSINGRINYDVQKITGAGVAGNGTNSGGSNVDARFNKLSQILAYRPTIGINGSDEELLYYDDPILKDDSGNTLVNPVLAAASEKDDRKIRTIQGVATITLRLGRGWTFRSTEGTRYQKTDRTLFYGPESILGKRSGIYGSVRNTEAGSFSTSNVLSYDKRWKKTHHLMVQLGQEYVKRWTKYVETGVRDLPTDDFVLDDMVIGTPSSASSSYNDDDRLLSFFGRVNYDYKSKYMFTATFRADGSSKFGKNNKWGYFPAVSAAWRMVEEPFIANLGIFSDLKLRAGYGLAGNNRIGSYNSLALMSTILTAVGSTTRPGYAATQIANPDLKWESNKTFNLGVDLGFFNNRLTISPEFYINSSHDLLINATLPMSSGYQTMLINAGATRNIGVDIAINSINIANRDFTWKSTLTLTHNQNKVTSLVGGDRQLYEARFGFNQNTHLLEVGKPIGQFYGLVTDGLYQVSDFNYNPRTKAYTLKEGVPYQTNPNLVQPGMWKFKDLDGNGIIDENDKTVIGNASPKLYGGFNNSLTWKNFDLSVFLTFSIGNDVLNATKLVSAKVGCTNNNALDIVNSSNRWMTIDAAGNPVTDPSALAALNEGKTIPAYYDLENGDNYVHSWAVEDASFLKISNITFGYTLENKAFLRKLGLTKLRAYFTGNNLYTFTKYTGFDPEVSTMRSPLTPGVDFGAYPLSRTFLFGLNLTF